MEPKNISLSSKEAILPQPIEGEETKAAAVETALAALNPSIEEGTPPSLEGRVTLTPASTSKEWQWVAVNYIILDSRESSQEAEKRMPRGRKRRLKRSARKLHVPQQKNKLRNMKMVNSTPLQKSLNVLI